ncbi:MAG: hypothetical protein Q4D57_03500 [Clostridia bacterium]|nr:hypothetical protein [Clostridia bacterium]
MANIFTKPNVRYSNIKTDAEQKVEEEVEGDVKDITFMTSNSKKLIKALYDGQKDEAAKLLAKYIWLGTRGSTMILITTGLLVLAEKEKIAKLQDDQQRIMDLFKNMAEGNGEQARINCEKSEKFKKAFKSILKCAPNIKDSKIADTWKKYVRQIGKITKWYIGLYALINNVKPVLEKSLVQKYYDVFVKNMSKSQDKKGSPTAPNEKNNKTTFPTLFEKEDPTKNFRIAIVGDDDVETKDIVDDMVAYAEKNGGKTTTKSNIVLINNCIAKNQNGTTLEPFNFEITTIGGKTLEEKLDPNSAHGKGMTGDYYQMILFVCDPHKYKVSKNSSIIPHLEEVVTKLKSFAPKPQIIFAPISPAKFSESDDECGQIANMALAKEREYNDPYGYQDFYNRPIKEGSKSIPGLFGILSECAIGRNSISKIRAGGK